MKKLTFGLFAAVLIASPAEAVECRSRPTQQQGQCLRNCVSPIEILEKAVIRKEHCRGILHTRGQYPPPINWLGQSRGEIVDPITSRMYIVPELKILAQEKNLKRLEKHRNLKVSNEICQSFVDWNQNLEMDKCMSGCYPPLNSNLPFCPGLVTP